MDTRNLRRILQVSHDEPNSKVSQRVPFRYWRNIAISLIDPTERHSQYVNPKHPPDKKYRDNDPRDVNYPVASCFRLPKIEHVAIVAGPRNIIAITGIDRNAARFGRT